MRAFPDATSDCKFSSDGLTPPPVIKRYDSRRYLLGYPRNQSRYTLHALRLLVPRLSSLSPQPVPEYPDHTGIWLSDKRLHESVERYNAIYAGASLNQRSLHFTFHDRSNGALARAPIARRAVLVGKGDDLIFRITNYKTHCLHNS